MISFKFRKERLESGHLVKRPIILVELNNNGTKFESEALLDSGSDMTTLSLEIAKGLGLKISEEKEELVGFKETTMVHTSRCEISVGRGYLKRKVSVPVLIVAEESINQEDSIIIGVNGFFDAFDIRFRLNKERIELKPVN